MFLFSILNSGANWGEIIICILAMVLAATIAIVMHEVSHGFVALKCGDYTAKSNGRLTLNPVAHFDLIGIIMMLLVGFGWAKPVPIDPRNFKNYKKGMFLVSIAGVTTNLILCSVGLFLLYILNPLFIYSSAASSTIIVLKMLLYYFLLFFTKLNFMLAFFNLLPIHPLDGFKLLNVFIKPGNGYTRFMYKNGGYVLIGLIILSRILNNVGLNYLDIFYWGNYLVNLLIGLVM